MYSISGSAPAALDDVDPMTGVSNTTGHRRIYELTTVPGWGGYEGRLVIAWPTGSAGRSWHRRADSMLWPVVGIADQHDPWPGWRAFHCDADELATLPHEWRSMLSHTKGVYLLIDRDDAGKQYVGSAKGNDSLLGRLLGYAGGGTNGNRGLTRGHRYEVSVLEPVAMLTPGMQTQHRSPARSGSANARRQWLPCIRSADRAGDDVARLLVEVT